ncbi:MULTISPECIES: hypothetical protein [Streptomyces]
MDTGLALLDQRLKQLEYLAMAPVIDRFNVTHHAASMYMSSWQPTKSWDLKADVPVVRALTYGVGISGSINSVSNHSHSYAGRSGGGGTPSHDHNFSGQTGGGGGHSHGFNLRANGAANGFEGGTHAVRAVIPKWRALTSDLGWVPWYSVQAHGSLTDTLKLSFLFCASIHYRVEIRVTKERDYYPPQRKRDSEMPTDTPHHAMAAFGNPSVFSLNLDWQHIKPGEFNDIEKPTWFVIWVKSSSKDKWAEGAGTPGTSSIDSALVAPPQTAMGVRRNSSNSPLIDSGQKRGPGWGFEIKDRDQAPILH